MKRSELKRLRYEFGGEKKVLEIRKNDLKKKFINE
jgi:hypothetical protein